MRERKTRHRQKCKGEKRETGKRGNMTWVENARLENGAPVCRGGGEWKMRDQMLWNAENAITNKTVK